MHVIAVQPIDGGWSVRSDLFDNDMIYQSGAAAEFAARDLGESLAREGRHAEIRIHLRDGSTVAQMDARQRQSHGCCGKARAGRLSSSWHNGGSGLLTHAGGQDMNIDKLEGMLAAYEIVLAHLLHEAGPAATDALQ